MKKAISVMLLLLMSLILCMGCIGNQYHAVLYDFAVEWINKDFADKNMIFDPDEGDQSLPDTRTFIVDNQELYEEIFVSNIEELQVDFEEQMLLVYTFRIMYIHPCEITKITLSDNILTINCKMKLKLFSGSACMPYQRWFVVKMDKLDIENAVFEELGYYYS